MKTGLMTAMGLMLLTACGAGGPSGPDMETLLHNADKDPGLRYGHVVAPRTWLDADIAPVIEAIKVDSRCRIPKASRNSKIVYIYDYSGGDRAPLHHGYKEASEGKRAQHDQTDVIVTDTEAPIFLMLESYNATLWNLQVAPGVKIDGVAVLSYEGSSLANGPEANRVGFLGFRGVENTRCWQRGGGKPVPVDLRVKHAAENGYEATASDRKKWEDDYKKRQDWMTQSVPRLVGGRIDQFLGRSGKGELNAILVGPVPDVPFAGQPVTQIYVPDNLNVAWGRRNAALEALDAIDQQALDDLRAGLR